MSFDIQQPITHEIPDSETLSKIQGLRLETHNSNLTTKLDDF